MAVTPNYSWPIPVATDYVKDGWDAIADLGNAIDSTVYGLGTSAVTTLSSGNFSAVSAVNLSSVLSSTYKYYNLRILVAANNVNFYLRARENTTDVTGSYSQRATTVNASGVTSNYSSGTLSNIQPMELFGASNYASLNVEIFRNDATIMHCTWAGNETYNGYYYQSGSAVRSGMTNFNGLSFLPSGGTMSGSYILTGIK